MVIVGKPGSGKTTLMENLLRDETFYKGKFNKILVISPSLSKLNFHFPRNDSNSEFSIEWIFEKLHEINVQ